MTHNNAFALSRNVIITYCFVSAIVALTINLLPIMLGSAADWLMLVPSQAGMLGSSLLTGMVLGSALAFLIQDKFNHRVLVAIGLITSGVTLIVSQQFAALNVLTLLWFIAGFGAGLPASIALVGLTSRGDQERLIGFKLMSEVVLGAALLYATGYLIVPRWGYSGVATLIGGAMLLALISVRSVPGRLDPIESITAIRLSFRENRPAWIALAAFLIYFSGQIGLWVFLERIGKDMGLEIGEISMVLSLLKLFGFVAVGAAAVIGVKYGMRWPYFVGPLLIIAGLVILQSADVLFTYAAGSWLWDVGFELTGVYQMAAIARLDRTGRLPALIPATAGLGAAFAPYTAGILVRSGNYLQVYLFTGICTVFAIIVFLYLISKFLRTDGTNAETLRAERG